MHPGGRPSLRSLPSDASRRSRRDPRPLTRLRPPLIGPVATSGPAPAVGGAAVFVTGIALGARAVSGGHSALAAAGLAAILAIDLAARGRGGKAARTVALVFWAAAGFATGRERIAAPEAISRAAFDALVAGAERVDRVEGVLTDFWSDAPPRSKGRLRAERIRVAGRWRAFPADVFLFVSGAIPPDRKADRGDRVSLVGRLRREELPASDRDIGLPWTRFRLSVKSSIQIHRKEPTILSRLAWPNRFLYSRLPPAGSQGEDFERNVRGPLAALLLGRTSELDRGMVARYRRGGLYHLLVVSGLHVGLAAGLVLAGLALARVGGKARDGILLGAVLLFVLVGGANPPAVRAGIVVAVFLAARLFERPISAGQAIGLSALALFAADPRQIYSIGTVLTFTAVGGLALLTEPIRRRLPARPDTLFTGIATTLAAQCATAPVVFWRFNLVSAGAWLTSPLAIPLSAALIAAGALLLVLFAAGIPAEPVITIFAIGSRLLELLADRAAGMAFLRPTPPLAGVVAVGVLMVAAVAARGRGRRLPVAFGIASAALFVALVLRPGPTGPERGFSIEALDVGQGDAILLRWRDRALLADGGGPFDLEAADFGRTRLLPKLLDRGITRLDTILATHPHPDHVLGLLAVLEELPVRAVWTSAGDDEAGLFARLLDVARVRDVPHTILRRGSVVAWNDVRLTVLHSGGRRRKVDPVNNQSAVVLFERDGRRALLTGDVGAPTERELIDRALVRPADVLKVAHHGSRTSTTPPFAAAVRPRLALLSCGRENRFGHPAPETLRTLASLQIPVFRTDRLSDVRVELLPAATRLAWRGLQ